MNIESHYSRENKSQTVSVSAVLSGKECPVHQMVDNRATSVIQKKLFDEIDQSSQKDLPIQRKENNTGLPDQLKSGIENLSGHSMDDVKVHYNSAKPAQLNAHAYAQGSNIHLAAGQEKHLPHEAWHVVQQKQGRVKPTVQLKGEVSINDDAGLEKEADVMGEKALGSNVFKSQTGNGSHNKINTTLDNHVQLASNLFQLFMNESLSSTKKNPFGKDMNSDFHKLAFQLMKNDKDGGWNLDFGNRETDNPIQAKLCIGSNWISVAETIYDKVKKEGGSDKVADLLVKWSKDKKEKGRIFGTWNTAIKAATQLEDAGGGRASISKILFILLIIFLIIVTMGGAGILFGANSRYEVRSDLSSTASIARRPLEPLMGATEIGRMQNLEQNSQMHALQSLTAQLPLRSILDSNPNIGKLFPEAEQLTAIEENMESLQPKLEALKPELEKAKPLLDTLGPNKLANPSNVGVYHEHVFLGPIPHQSPVAPPQSAAKGPEPVKEKQSPKKLTDIGAMDDGVRPDKQELMHTYEKPVAHYDRDLMERAALAVAADFGKYKGITHNCQDYADAVVTAYKELGGKQIVPTMKSQVTLFVTDMIIEYGSYFLEKEVAKGVISELAALKGSNPPSSCAVAVSNKLGISSETFGGAVDEVLKQPIPIGQTGIKVPMNKILCDKAGLDMSVQYIDAELDKERHIHEEGTSTIRKVLCTKKGKQNQNVLLGVVFELVREKGEPQILAGIPSFIKTDEFAKNKLMTDLTSRLAQNLFTKLNLMGLCG